MVVLDNIEYPNIDANLHLEMTEQELLNEWFWYLDHPNGELTLKCNRTRIIRYFQQDNFYKVEKQLWKDHKIQTKLIQNRLKYLNKTPSQLTTSDILRGFKISTIYHGYSGFNPQLCKWFYEVAAELMGVKISELSCYDPCGGWGHRMIGSTEISQYIYNDLSKSTYDAVNNIKSYFDIWNCITYNGDAASFVPEEFFNVMFTCPPYYNVEHYECGDFKNVSEYNDFINSLFDVFNNTKTCKVFGLVIREDLIGEHTNYINRYELTQYNKSYLNTKRKNKEYLYIFSKI